MERLLISLSASPDILKPSGSRIKETFGYGTREHHKKTLGCNLSGKCYFPPSFLNGKSLHSHLITKFRSE